MPDEPQNPILEENPIPTSPSSFESAQDLPESPILDAPIPPSTSEPVEVPSVAPEAPTEAVDTVPLKDDNGANGSLNQPKEAENIDNPINPNITIERTPDTVTITEVMPVRQAQGEQPTAQIPVSEPFIPEPDLKPKQNTARELWGKALSVIQIRKRKKLDKIMSLFLKQSKITNDEVEKLLHVSDATATRYLSILEKEGKIKQSGRTGQSVSYSRI